MYQSENKVQMKTKIFFISIVIFVIYSCNDAFMDRFPTDSFNDVNFWHNERELSSYCNALYPLMINGHGTRFDIGAMLDGDNQSDNMAPATPNAVAAGQQVVPETGGGWSWNVIRRCNYFLDLYNQTPIPQEVKDRYAGEIKFFKSMEYFRLVKRFGDVPWYTHVVGTGPELYASRDSRILVMDSVLTNIDWAIEKLPAKTATIAVKGRVNRDVALALKARICLHEGTFRKYHGIQGYEKFLREAVSASQRLITEGNYSLNNTGNPNSDYSKVFNTLNLSNMSEVIMFRDYDQALDITTGMVRRLSDFTDNLSATKSLVDSYLCTDGKPISQSSLFQSYNDIFTEIVNRDPRLTQTVGGKIFPSPPTGTITKPSIPGAMVGEGIAPTGYHILKYWVNDAAEYARSQLGTLDAPVFRFGETLLVYAEAKAELGECDQPALDLSINKLRARAGMPNMVIANLVKDTQSDFPTLPVLIDEIRRERRVELALEGFRYDDLMRWKAGKLLEKEVLGMKFVQTMYPAVVIGNQITVNADGFITPYAKSLPNGRKFDDTNDKMYYFPLPTEELVLNKNLTQNPGWEK